MRKLMFLFAPLVACSPNVTALPEVAAVDSQYCDLLTDCWGLYGSVSECLVQHADTECRQADPVMADACVEWLAEQTNTCVPPTAFEYPQACTQVCVD